MKGVDTTITREMGVCYYCGKTLPLFRLKPLPGDNTKLQCVKSDGRPYHRQSTKEKKWKQHEAVLNANPEKKARAWEITIPSITITIREVVS